MALERHAGDAVDAHHALLSVAALVGGADRVHAGVAGGGGPIPDLHDARLLLGAAAADAAAPLAVAGQHHQAVGEAGADLGVEKSAPFRVAHLAAVLLAHAEQQLEAG